MLAAAFRSHKFLKNFEPHRDKIPEQSLLSDLCVWWIFLIDILLRQSSNMSPLAQLKQ